LKQDRASGGFPPLVWNCDAGLLQRSSIPADRLLGDGAHFPLRLVGRFAGPKRTNVLCAGDILTIPASGRARRSIKAFAKYGQQKRHQQNKAKHCGSASDPEQRIPKISSGRTAENKNHQKQRYRKRLNSNILTHYSLSMNNSLCFGHRLTT
jgi:hypothetical protein